MSVCDLCSAMEDISFSNSKELISKLNECMQSSARIFTENPSLRQIDSKFVLNTFNEKDFTDAMYDTVETYNYYAYIDFINENICHIEWYPIIFTIKYHKDKEGFIFNVSSSIIDDIPLD